MDQHVLIPTLGVEPRVVTLAVDLLRGEGYPLAAVIVVHTLGEAVQPALTRLAEEFARPGACGYRAIPIEREGWPVADFRTEADTVALLRTLYRTVLAEKRAGRRVPLSIAGGWKPMAVYGMVVAQLLFDEDDRVWYLLSENWCSGEARVMHVRPEDRVWLVPVPVLRWSTVSPVLTELAVREDPWEAIQTQQSMKQEQDRRRKQGFIEHDLTRAERELVRLACRGLDNATITRQLVQGAAEVFRGGNGGRSEQELTGPLYEEIGRLKVEINWLKKQLWACPGREGGNGSSQSTGYCRARASATWSG